MHNETDLIFTIAVSLALALVGGYLAVRLRLPPLVGYLLAGIAVGPFTPGVVADRKVAQQLAEIGVILLFFVAVGMLFDPAILIDRPFQVLATVLIVVLGKSAAAFGIVLLIRRDRRTAAFVSAALAQIGEFSFILAELGLALGALSAEGLGLIVAGSLISITLNPLMFFGADRWFAGRGSARQAA